MHTARRTIVQYFNDFTIEHQCNYSNLELIVVSQILDNITAEDIKFVNNQTNKTIVLPPSLFVTSIKSENLIANPAIIQLTDSLISRYTVIKHHQDGLNEYIPNFCNLQLTLNGLSLDVNYKLIPIILDAKSKHPQGRWNYAIRLNSNNATALYKVLQNFVNQTISITPNELKEQISIQDHYPRYGNFKQRVIIPALAEINGKTDLEVSCTEIFEQRKVKLLRFEIAQSIN